MSEGQIARWTSATPRALLAAAALVVLGACGSEYQDVPGGTIREWIEHSATAGYDSDSPPLDDLILYLDGSLSMQGYPNKAGAHEYAMALRAVSSVVDKLNPRHEILYRKVTAEIGPLEDRPATLFDASRNRTFYNGGESNLAGAIGAFDQPDPDLREGSGIARCHILITDGVQHLSQSTPEGECQAGSDPRCVNLAVRRLIDSGWGVHLFGIRSRFSGPIYSELRQEWLEGNYRAVSSSDPSRYRPFLIYLFTNHVDYMHELVPKLRRELLVSGIEPELIGELPLTLPLVEASRIETRTDLYQIETDLGQVIENPLQTVVDVGEDVDGEPMPDRLSVATFSYEDVGFLPPFAAHLTARVEFTEAGQILFSRTSADAGSLLQPPSISEVPRPPHWYRSPEQASAEEEGSPSIEGSGRLSDAGGTGDEDQVEGEESEEQPLPEWPPPGWQPKQLRFDEQLQPEAGRPPYIFASATGSDGEEVDCTLPSGCHLLMHWGRNDATFLPITLLRFDARFDPTRLVQPRWLTDWATEDDTRLDHANRILNLDRLTSGLLDNAQIARQGLDPWYLLVYPVPE